MKLLHIGYAHNSNIPWTLGNSRAQASSPHPASIGNMPSWLLLRSLLLQTGAWTRECTEKKETAVHRYLCQPPNQPAPGSVTPSMILLACSRAAVLFEPELGYTGNPGASDSSCTDASAGVASISLMLCRLSLVLLLQQLLLGVWVLCC